MWVSAGARCWINSTNSSKTIYTERYWSPQGHQYSPWKSPNSCSEWPSSAWHTTSNSVRRYVASSIRRNFTSVMRSPSMRGKCQVPRMLSMVRYSTSPIIAHPKPPTNPVVTTIGNPGNGVFYITGLWALVGSLFR